MYNQASEKMKLPENKKNQNVWCSQCNKYIGCYFPSLVGKVRPCDNCHMPKESCTKGKLEENRDSVVCDYCISKS